MSTAGTMPASKNEPENLSYLQKVWRYRRNLNIEPFYFFYVMASVFNYIAMLNLPVEKACRVNLGYSKEVCTTTLDKGKYDIDCDAFDFENTTEFSASMNEMFFDNNAMGFNYTVCKAEVGAQKLVANVVGKRATIANFFPLIVLLFAGGWSDRYNKRKACMLLPVIGECLSFLCLLISSLFFEQIPMEFGSYLEAIVPAVFGGQTLCFMAIDSYMTISTPEEDRIFRFGIYAMFGTFIQVLGLPVSGYLFQYLGYIMSFSMAASFNAFAILYIIFVLKEPKSCSPAPPPLPNQPPPCLHSHGSDNPAYEITSLEQPSSAQHANKNVSFEMSADGADIQISVAPPPVVPAKKNCFSEFFDPTLVKDYVKFPFKRRPNYGRMLLAFIILAYMLVAIQIVGEGEYPIRFAFKKLNWNGNDISFYNTFSALLGLAGTFIGTAIFSKLLKFSDALVGFISSVTSVLSKALFAFSYNTASFYAASVADLFVSMRVIAVKTIGSSIVEEEELSKMYSIFSIFQPISGLIFTPIYSSIYENTVNSFPGAIFLFSEVFAIPNVLVFVICYFLVKRRLRKLTKLEKVDDNQNTTTTSQKASNGDVEVTSL